MNHLHTTLWGVLPYLVVAFMATGTMWRYRYDRFGFTTRSSQLHESRLLRIGGPLFHFGLLLVIGGHLIGLLIPEAFTDRVHVHEWLYHANALFVGGIAGLATLAGLAILLYRRLRVPAVRGATSRSDRAVYPLLAAVIVAGLAATASTTPPHHYDYRLGVSVWVRSLFALDPDVSAMSHAPFVYQTHTLLGMALFALWPFSRLVHAFTAPVGYLARPYIVYRSRGARHVPVSRSAPVASPQVRNTAARR
ncbi:respiratory nitrate reductase subunit gamma [Streptomyces spectabilis]|uniref:Nitrate reductase-like protein NarX n=1 Tax=Streptomyces spectabilis TaxID=68270 RepID=A0A5P2XKM7_STRST|nr:respiratory nitrate reductase subunit gamma [Streptomyces spectabilis]MBB5102467.1 nitrate reductase gamma subunit [Streptomyces spectabilis]MCI3907508.1 respiratory nitrate reductase subunit gamma [Streptomyces spectabilis]QEV64204.1 respiratory nitrate reductase subunit gamma [Streptomyces spectabilis]GGV31684.1 nitrate reductase subunit gamma [Streptomyces spectabilis]